MKNNPPSKPSVPIPAGRVPPFRLALDHFRRGQFQEASDLLNAALQTEPNNPELWHLAGNAAKGLGQLATAERCWHSTLALKPDHSEAHYNLGVLLQEQNRFAEAATHYQTALAKPAWHPRALNNLGVMLIKDSKPNEALHYFEEATVLDPTYGKAHHNRGRALVVLGRFDEARQAFESALALVPESGKAPVYRSLSLVKRFAAGDRELHEMEALEGRIDTLTPGDQMELHFALGKAYDDLGDYERSFRHFIAGNREKRRQTRYYEAATLGKIDRIRAAYSPALMSARKGIGVVSDVPIFIVGMPRSGSTLVEQILCSHPDVYGAGECEDFRQLAEAILLPGGTPLYPDGIAELPDDALTTLGRRYLEQMRARSPEAKRITDKSLINFQHVGLIHLVLPSAKIIHTCRSAVETCLSCFMQMFQGEHGYTYELTELGRYWRAQDRLMAHWREVLPPGVLLEVGCEDLVEDLEGQTRRILTHCGLNWDPACLNFYATQRPIYTASATQVRQPIFRTTTPKSQRYGALLDPLLKALKDG